MQFGSNLYHQSVALRDDVLRKPLGIQYSDADLQAESNQHHLALLDESCVVAILLMKPINSKRVKMRQVAVKPNYQGRGLGKELVRYSEEWSVKNNYEVVELHARQVAVNFYLQNQYEVVSDEFMEVGIPHFKMRKFLNQ